MELTRSGHVVLLGLLAVVAPPAVAQDPASVVTNEWRAVRSHVSAEVTADDDGVDVHVRYVLTGSGSGVPVTPVEVGLLHFEGTEVTEIQVDGRGQPVVLWTTMGRHSSASFHVQSDSVTGDGIPVHVRYRVGGAIRGSGAERVVRIPIVSGPIPGEALPGHFRVEVRAPEGWAISEPFPSGLRAGVGGVYEASLPVTPAMVGFRAATDGVRRVGFARSIDLLTLTLLLVFCGFGWRHLRRIQS